MALIAIGFLFAVIYPLALAVAGEPAKQMAASADSQVQIPQGLSSQEIDAYLAGLSEEQVRQVLSQKLKNNLPQGRAPAAEDHPDDSWMPIESTFNRMEEAASAALDRIVSVFKGEQTAASQWPAVVNRLSDGKGGGHLMLTILMGLALIIVGFVLERLLLRATEDLRKHLLTAVPLGKLQQLGKFISRFLLDILGVAVYVVTTFVLFVLIYDKGNADHGIVSVFLIISYYFVIIMFAAKVILSPFSPGLRLLPLKDEDARFLYRWIFRTTLIAALFAGPSLIFQNVGGSEELHMLFYSAAGLGVIICFIGMIWQSRKRLADAICREGSDEACEENTMRVRFAKTWHFFAILYVVGAGAFWLVNLWISGRGEIVSLIASLFLIPIFIGIDQWMQRLLKIASGESREVIDLSGEEAATEIEESLKEIQEDKKTDFKHYVPFIKRAFRVVLVAFLFFIILRLWGIDLSFGRLFTRTALSIVVALLLGVIVWEFSKARIDRKLQEEMPETDKDMEEGGAGGSRLGTLLILLRKFILSVLFVIIGLIILSSMGINIGPLIAGAGVIGLAIGFGAQTLVKDIISGIFFLIDDAFRVGDYVETAGMRGSVEHISLRSLRLRHPRGMVHTIPFGDMGTVTNLSRDYIITKLDIRVRYDTNVDKVRKIIKKINTEIGQDEQMGPNLLDKIKSQGVREMDDSAMIMRVKFKTIPGEQFVIRREVYRRIQEEFAANGIEFAHRNVTVYLPPDNSQAEPQAVSGAATEPSAEQKQKMLEAGAAAAAAIQAEEDAKQQMKKE
jgi:small-conductance mechanosensitive channel